MCDDHRPFPLPMAERLRRERVTILADLSRPLAVASHRDETSDRNHKSPVWRQSMIMRYEQKTLFNRLRNKHPVKRIVMVQGQRRHTLCMTKTNRDFHDSRVPTEPNHLLGRNRNLTWPDRMLYGHFPNRSRTHIEHVIWILQNHARTI